LPAIIAALLATLVVRLVVALDGLDSKSRRIDMFTIKVCTWKNGAPIVESEQATYVNFQNFLEEAREIAEAKGVDYVIEVWDGDTKLGYIGALPSGGFGARELVVECERCYGDGSERSYCGDGCCSWSNGEPCARCDGKGYEVREAS
jgi:hypothetical protein